MKQPPIAPILARMRESLHGLAGPARTRPEAHEVQGPSTAEAEVHAETNLHLGYFVLLFCSGGIATLGLLQSSAAVVIGAMLISPLMTPILGMGLALARLAPRHFERAALNLAIGAAASIAVAALIVWLSPLKEVTPEILARTRPTLLDLAIATLSGVVGAYVTMARRGAVIAGVAIATALTPPLAVTGFGLATGGWELARGAFLLFLTNVVAILGAVLAVARFYGVTPADRRHGRWEELVLLALMLLLATPLAFSLRQIVLEATDSQRARQAIGKAFAKTSAHITSLSVAEPNPGKPEVHAVIVTRRYVPDASKAVQHSLGRAAVVDVEQVLAADGPSTAERSGGALGNRALAQSAPTVGETREKRLADMLRGVATIDAINSDGGVLRAAIHMPDAVTLADYKDLEAAAQRFFPDTRLELTPPWQPTSTIPFAKGSARLDARADEVLNGIAWALGRWGFRAARVTGLASASGSGATARDQRLAQARAAAVRDRLQSLGVPASSDFEVRVPAPAQDVAQLWAAVIRPAASPPKAETDAQ